MFEAEPFEIDNSGITHYPFREIKKLTFPKSVDDDPYDRNLQDPEDSLVSILLTFGDSTGRLCVLPITLETIEDDGEYDLPMGYVDYREQAATKDGRVSIVVLEAPLVFAINTKISSFADYQALCHRRTDLLLGGSIYSIDCIMPPDPEDEVEKYFSAKRTPLILHSFHSYRPDGIRRKAAIPGLPEVLATVGMRFEQLNS